MPLPPEITAAPPSFGITPLDSIVQAVQGYALFKIVPTYGALTSDVGQRAERRFLLKYSAEDDPMDISAILGAEPYFERVTVNTLLWFEPSSTNRLAPGDTTRFAEQWYFDNTDAGDLSDLDMPETWAIELGDPDLVIGIFDSGTMVDQCTGSADLRLHSDLNYFFLPEEDHGTQGVLKLRKPSAMKRPVATGENKTVRIDITEAVRYWLENPSKNYGLALGSFRGAREGSFVMKADPAREGALAAVSFLLQ